MSAAAARRKKQLAARAASAGTDNPKDIVLEQLDQLMNQCPGEMTEEVAYEALQLGQSSIRKRIQTAQFEDGCTLAYKTALQLLQKKRVSVASQLLQLLADILRETHTIETDEWVQRLIELHNAHVVAMDSWTDRSGLEYNRLQRLQKSWLLLILKWSSELGTIKYGHPLLHELVGNQCWSISLLSDVDDSGTAASKNNNATTKAMMVEEQMDLQCDAVQHMVLAEKPLVILQWLKTFPAPTKKQTKTGHDCPPAVRDMLLTRGVMLFCAVENLRDANVLVRQYIDTIEERSMKTLIKSYTSKEDQLATSHVVFCSMLLRICEKDNRTGPLYQWLLKSFKRELDTIDAKNQVIQSYHTKIGKMYFGLEPPPSMMKMMENMMSGMGGGMGGMGGMNPAMMQAALASMKG